MKSNAASACNARSYRVYARKLVSVASVFAASFCFASISAPPSAKADDHRLNNGVFSNIFTAQQRNGCITDPRIDGRLVQAAQRHSLDVLNNREVDGDNGSDGSTPQTRAIEEGFAGPVAETVAINPSMAISGIEILNQWWYDPQSRSIMQDCSHNAVGVWSENSLDRTVVVAMYGQL